MLADTREVIKYFLFQDLERKSYLNCDLLREGDDLFSKVLDSQLPNDLEEDDSRDPTEDVMDDIVICAAMETEFLKYVSTNYYDQVISEVVKKNGEVLEYASAEYQRDPEIIRASYSSCPLALKYSKGIHSYDPMFIFECLNRDARGLFYLNRTEKKDLFNKFSSDLRRRIDYLSSVLGDGEDYFFDDNQDYVSGDELEKIIDVRYLEFIEKTQKRALNELADMFSCELFYDDKRQNDLHKQLQICEGSEVGATIASYLSVKEAVSTMRVCKSGLFSKGLPDAECQGNANKYRKIND